MPDKILLSTYNGLEEYQHIDQSRPGDLIIETVQDCQPIIDHVKQMRDLPVGKEWRLVASVPMCFFDKWAKEGSLHDRAKMHRWLNDPDNAAFRVWNGRIGPSRQI